MDTQTAYEKIRAHMLTMTCKADVNGFCSYRSETGPCPVGVLLTDEEAAAADQEATHGFRPNIVWLAVNGFAPSVDGVNLEFLMAVQELHDQSLPTTWDTAQMVKELDFIAAVFFLKVVK